MTTTQTDELLDLERSAWKALSTSGDEAAAFFSAMLADDVLMLLPTGMVIDDRDQVIDSMHGDPWTSYELSDERVVPLGENGAVVAYSAHAQRGDNDYRALVNSTYVRQGGAWRLTLHQQTPF
jgi:hypothetical protein